MKIAIVSLGCPKNQVDADVFCRALLADGHETVADPAEADAIIVNTCGFIQSAKEDRLPGRALQGRDRPGDARGGRRGGHRLQ